MLQINLILSIKPNGRVLSMYKDIIWDFDGTLFDTYPAMTAAFQKALMDEGFHEGKDNILKLIKISFIYAVNYYEKIIKNKDDFTECFHHYENTIDKELFPPMPYAIETCRDIKVSGGRSFIFTHRGDSVLKLLDYYSMLGYFTEIVSLDYRFKRKPEPDGFLYIMGKHCLNSGQSLAVGDRELDILAAHNAGIKACLLNDEIIKSSINADYKINSLKDLYGIIDINYI